MLVEVKVPAVGESISEGVISRWLKNEGDVVRADEALFELETDKVNTEVPAGHSGRLKHLAKKGDTVAIGAAVAQIDTSVAAAAPAPAVAAPPPAAAPAPARVAAPPPAAVAAAPMSPLARKVAQDTGADLSRVAGTGPGGRIMKDDVLAAAAPAGAPVPQARPAGERISREPMSMLRRRIAERLLESQQSTATLTTFNEVDMSAIIALRNKYKDAFKEKHGVGLGFMSFFIKAAIEALKEFPRVNAMIDGNDIVYHHYHDIGVAVSTDKGLMVPVIRDADGLSFAGVEKTIGDFAARARAGTIGINDLQGGTFTITNGGVFGSLMATPIINPPQVGILGMHKIMDRAVVVDGQVIVRPMMYIALSYDHRIIDGKESVSFLVRVKECVEKPERMLLDV